MTGLGQEQGLRLLQEQCLQCPNQCRIELALDAENTVVWARRTLPARGGPRLVRCANLDAAAGLSVEEALRLVHVEQLS
jgi:hypothetical protein